MKVLLSIIIPIYNAERYLEECLDSVSSIVFKDWECILVDDGSSDKSAQICDSYSKNDSRFRVIHKENGGVSSARNIGLANAKGDWISFIDSDDWVTTDFALVLKENIEADAIHFGYKKEKENHEYVDYVSREIGLLSIEHFLSYHNFSPCSWSYFFRRDSINKMALVFDTSLKYSEDTFFIIKYLLNSHNIYVIQDTLYFYRFNVSSAVHTKRYYSHSSDDLQVLDKLIYCAAPELLTNCIYEFIFNYQFDNFRNALTYYTKILPPWRYITLFYRFRCYYRIGKNSFTVKYNKYNKVFFYIPIIYMIYKNLKTWLYKLLFE